MKQLALDLAAPAPPSFDSFVVGRNAEVLASLRRAVSPGAAERFLYLWGGPGSGRSHLLRATVAAAGARAAYVACAAGAALPEGLAALECVALDDVERLDASAQQAAFRLYEALRARGAALVAAGAAPPGRLGLREDLATRLSWGLVYEVQALSDEEKRRALAEHAARRGFALAPGVCDYLLSRAPRDLGSLLALVEALDRYSLEQRRPVTVPLARELLAAREGAEGGR